jgi:hypothetical protein
VYDELRKLAAAKLAHERPGQTLFEVALFGVLAKKLVLHKNASPAHD